jgi:hypothetical protein
MRGLPLAEVVLQSAAPGHCLGKLPPNAPLRSDDLRAGYDVGIGPLREALSRFVAERLFDVNQITNLYWTAQTGLANTVVEPIRKISAAAIERLKAYPFKTPHATQHRRNAMPIA